MDTTLLLSSASLLISLLSVAYARQAASAATKGNRIALHTTHRQIYDAMIDFRSLFVAMDLHPTDEEINQFFRASVAPAQLYLSSPLADRMYGVYRESWDLFRAIDDAESSLDGSKSKWPSINRLQELGRTDLDELIVAVGAEIRLSDS